MKTIATQKKEQVASDLPVRDLIGAGQDNVPLPAWLQVQVSPELLAQVISVQRARRYIGRAHTKDRSEVRGGGKKPWPQKGTGRARHASTRSPLWVGGGITFGPRSHKRHLPAISRAMQKKALAGLLSAHAQRKSLRIVRINKEITAKTKDLASKIGRQRNLLIIINSQQKNAVRAAGNIKSINIKADGQVNAFDIMRARQVWIEENALAVLQNRCS